MQNMKLLTQREKNVSEKVGYPYIIPRLMLELRFVN